MSKMIRNKEEVEDLEAVKPAPKRRDVCWQTAGAAATASPIRAIAGAVTSAMMCTTAEQEQLRGRVRASAGL